MKHTLGAQKKGAFETEPHPMAVPRGSGSEPVVKGQDRGSGARLLGFESTSASCKCSDCNTLPNLLVPEFPPL